MAQYAFVHVLSRSGTAPESPRLDQEERSSSHVQVHLVILHHPVNALHHLLLVKRIWPATRLVHLLQDTVQRHLVEEGR